MQGRDVPTVQERGGLPLFTTRVSGIRALGIRAFVVIILSTVLDGFMYKGSREVAPIRWGKVPDRSQYALFLLAISFTWLMGLMGYVRSGIRQHWHVVDIMRDNSPDAYTPTLGYAANVVSTGTAIFMAIVIFIFWLAQISTKKSVTN